MPYVGTRKGITPSFNLERNQMAQKAFSPVIAQSICAEGIAVFDKTHKKEADIKAANDALRAKFINRMLDAMRIACDTDKKVFTKGNAATNPALNQVSKFFDTIIERGTLTKSTADNYRSGFWHAFHTNVEWTPNINNQKTEEKKKAEGEAKPTTTTTTAKTKVITLEEAQRSFSVALAQLRAVNQSELASELLDVMLERFPEFKESTVK